MTIWLMASEEAEKIEALLNTKIDAKTAQEISAVVHCSHDVNIDKNGIGEINISGALMPNPNPLLDFLGADYTAYSDIDRQVEALEGDPSVKAIKFNMNTGGGDVNGLYNTMGAMAGIKKPTMTQASGKLASAGYMLASQTDSISAIDDLVMVGSVGMVTGGTIDATKKEITNTASPKKRNDLTTPEGVENVKAMLDDVYSIVEEKIASGRGIDTDTIKANYGQGAVMTARTALKNGMIDAVGDNKPAITATKQELKSMDLAQLKADHADLYNSIFASGKEAGKKELKELTEAHLTLADASGDSARAMEDIKAGNEVTPLVQAHHIAQGIKNSQIEQRDLEQPKAVDASAEPEIDEQAKLEKEIAGIEGLEVEL